MLHKKIWFTLLVIVLVALVIGICFRILSSTATYGRWVAEYRAGMNDFFDLIFQRKMEPGGPLPVPPPPEFVNERLRRGLDELTAKEVITRKQETIILEYFEKSFQDPRQEPPKQPLP